VNNNSNFEEIEEQRDVRNLLFKYLAHWKWFVLSGITFSVLAVLYVRYKQPIYASQATVLIKDDGGGMPGMEIFEDFGLSGGSSNLDNEIQILKSRKLTESVIKKLELNKSYISRGERSGFIAGEMYVKSPIQIIHASHDSLLYAEETSFDLSVQDEFSFELSELDGEEFGVIKFGEEISTSIGSVTINKTELFDENHFGLEYVILITPLNESITELQEILKIDRINKDADILLISLKGSVIQKNNDIINELIFQHELEGVKDQNEITENTRDFIRERMLFISRELSEVDSASSTFKTENNLIDVGLNAKLLLEKESELEKSIIETNIQLELVRFMNELIDENKGVENLLPSNLGFEDHSVATTILSYNTMVLERNRLLQGSSFQNPNVLKLEGQLINIKKSLQSSLHNIVSTANMKLEALNSKARQYDSKLASMPSYEKEYRDIFRQQQIKETLYLYLLEKREENEIALVVTVANSKVIDNAYSDGEPVSPKKKIILLGALLLGFILPIGIIYVIDLLDNKVHSTDDLNTYRLPHVAIVPLSKEGIKLVALDNPRSVMSEAFRILRTNVSFLFTEQKAKGNTILITSTIAAEGKTSVSLNLAHSLALTGKKTVIIGLDLRAPKLLEYLELPKGGKGVSDFIVNPNLSAADISFPVEGTENLFMIGSGTTPPNPSELLMKPRLLELLEQVKKEYDYVIVDTAPVGLVTDTLVVADIADVTLYIVRANKLEKEMLKLPSRLYAEKKLNNMSVVLNGVEGKNGTSYGYGYGYGYGDDFESDNKKWWRKGK